MKLTFFLVLFIVFNSYASSYSQNQVVNIDLKDASLYDVFNEIKRQTGLRFLFNADQLENTSKFDLKADNETVKNVLDKILAETKLTCEYSDEVIMLVPKKTTVQQTNNTRIVSGKVIDKKNQPLPGATIRVENATIGVTTDYEGNFRLTVPNDVKNLIVSFIGFQVKKQNIEKGSEFIITLEEDVEEIEEVVITGYFKLDKRMSASSVTSIKMEDIMIPNVATVDQMLQGQVPGLMVISPSGSPNAAPKMRIRGSSTIYGNAAPVWVIDGVIWEDPVSISNDELNTILSLDQDANISAFNENASLSLLGNAITGLNPYDIETIDFLKDASATAIYGTRAANGVIVITTKRGHVGKPMINFSSSFGFTGRPYYSQYKLMNSKERIGVSRDVITDGYLYSSTPYKTGYEGAYFDLINRNITNEQFNQRVAELETKNTDWFKYLTQNAFNQDYNISVSGGSDVTRYYFSIGFNDSKGTSKGDNMQRYNINLNLSSKLTDIFTLDGKISFADRKSDGFYQVNPYDYALQTSRVVDKDEFYTTQYTTNPQINSNQPLSYNIFNEIKHTGNTANVRQLNSTVNVSAKYNDFRFEGLFGIGYANSLNKKWAGEQSNYIARIRGYDYGAVTPNSEEEKSSRLPNGGILLYDNTNLFNYTGRVSATYNTTFNYDHSLTAFVAFEAMSNKYDGFSTEEWGYFPDRGHGITYEYDTSTSGNIHINDNSSLKKHTAKIQDTKNNSISMIGSFAYGFRSKYILNFNIRSDASNRFGQYTNNKFLPIWSVAGRWTASEETFIKKLNFIDDLSFRASYGWQGNIPQSVGPNLVVRYPTTVINRYTGEYILSIARLPYPDLKWEKTSTTNLGVSLTLFKGRISGDFEYYRKNTKNVIFNLDVAAEYGTETTFRNGSNLKNSGIELGLTFVPIQSRDFVWTLSHIYSKNTNKVFDTKTDYTLNDYLGGNAFENGKPVNSIYSWKFTGLDPETGYATFENTSKIREESELSDDPKTYLVYSGQKDPKMNGSFNTSLRFRNISLNANFNYAFGHVKRLNYMFNGAMKMPMPQDNLNRDLLRRWKKPGDENHTNIPGFVIDDNNGSSVYLPTGVYQTGNSYEMYNVSDIRTVKGNFVRCRNLMLSYYFPDRISNKLGLAFLNCSFNVTNPFTFCSKKFQGQDPEQDNTGTTALPITQTYSFSLNLSF